MPLTLCTVFIDRHVYTVIMCILIAYIYIYIHIYIYTPFLNIDTLDKYILNRHFGNLFPSLHIFWYPFRYIWRV